MNLQTNAMERLTKMLVDCDTKLKTYGVEPYGMRKLTDKEQRERVKNMTPGELESLIVEYGEAPVNKLLNKYWQEDNNAII